MVINRFRVPAEVREAFRADLQAAFEALAVRPGFVSGGLGCNLDEPDLWVLHTQWRDVGSYRRALSSYEVKLTAVSILSQAIDEPSAYEPVLPGAALNEQRSRSIP